MGLADKLRDFWTNTKRVIRVARRPTAQEVRLIARVSGIGILLVGGISFVIQILGNLVNQFFQPASDSSTTALMILAAMVSSPVSPQAIITIAGDPMLLEAMAGVLQAVTIVMP